MAIRGFYTYNIWCVAEAPGDICDANDARGTETMNFEDVIRWGRLLSHYCLNPNHRHLRPINLLLGGGNIGEGKIGEPTAKFCLGAFQTNV